MLRKTPKDKKTGLPKKYVPKSLTKEDKEKQVKSIKEKTRNFWIDDTQSRQHVLSKIIF